MAAIESRIYVGGHRVTSPSDLQGAAGGLERPESVAWIGLVDPPEDELETAAVLFGLHELAIEDAHKGHQRAKLERYGDTVFVVVRPAWYDDRAERIDIGEVHLFVGPQFVITVRRGDRLDLSGARDALEADPEFLATGAEAMLTAFLDVVVDGYAPVVAGLVNDIDEVEDTLFEEGSTDPALSKRIYKLLSQVIALQRAIGPLPEMVQGLLRGAGRYGTGDEVQNRLRNVLDHTIRVTERVDGIRSVLENALTVHSTLVTTEQNEAMRRMSSASLAQGEASRQLAEETIEQGEQVKKISSWAAILFTPTLVAGIYGMNFDHMPELHWTWGYPFALALMVGFGFGLWRVFKRRRWL